MSLRRGSAATAAVLLLLLGVAACGSGEKPERAPAADSGAESPPAKSSSPAAAPSTLAPKSPVTSGIAARGGQRIEMANSDWLEAGFGSIWVKRDDGAVVRLDDDGRELGTFAADVRPGLCQGLGVGEEAVWACAGPGTLIRVDPVTERVDEVEVEKVVDQGRMVVLDGQVWVLTEDGKRLTPITEAADSTVGAGFDLGHFCTDLASGSSDVLWVVCTSEGLVLRVDPQSGEVTGRVELELPRSASVAEDLWVVFEDGIARIDPETLEVLTVHEIYPGLTGAVRAFDDSVWVRQEVGPFLTRIDPASGDIVETIEAPDLPSGGDVLQVRGLVWASAYDDGTVVRLPASAR